MLRPHTTAEATDTAFYVLWSLDGLQAFNPTSGAVEAYQSATDDAGTYGNVMTDPRGSGSKEADWPANAPDGDYRVTYYVQDAATPTSRTGEPIDEWLQVRKIGSVWSLVAGNPDTSSSSGTNVAITPILSGVTEVVLASSVGGVTQDLELFQNTKNVFQWKLTDGSGEPLNVKDHQFSFVKHSADGSVSTAIPAENVVTLSSRPDDFPDFHDIVQTTIPSSFMSAPDVYSYKAWDLTLEFVFGSGMLVIRPAPKTAST